MSFSGNVKKELVRLNSRSRHCQIAELAAILAFSGRITGDRKNAAVQIETENTGLAKKFLTLIRQIFQYEVELKVNKSLSGGRQHSYKVRIKGQENATRILQTVRYIDANGELLIKEELVDGLIVQRTCCQRAFIRGAYLAAGSMSDPEKAYHFEIVCTTEAKARQLQLLMNRFELDAKIVERKNHYVVYLKEGSQIVDILNIMEAHKSLMDLENVRILKNMRNHVNRQVNCETANINKTVNAALRQIEDIRYIEQQMGLDRLSPQLQEMAQVRLENPDASLVQLSTYLSKSVGKSGVNHRLRKISEIAELMREMQEQKREEEK